MDDDWLKKLDKQVATLIVTLTEAPPEFPAAAALVKFRKFRTGINQYFADKQLDRPLDP